MYSPGERIVHPLHGAGTIAEIVKQRVDGREKQYYVLLLTKQAVRILIPVDGCEAIGVRPLVDRDRAQALLASFPQLETGSDASWNRRYRENMLRLKSGRLEEVLGVVKGLMLRDRSVGLSTGERRMLSAARQILFSELTAALETDEEKLTKLLNEMLDREQAAQA